MTTSNRRLFTAYASMLCLSVAMLAIAGCGKKQEESVPAANAPVYKADGAFDAAAAKEAYYAMMRGFNYPIPDILKTDNFWVADFLQRDFKALGMGGIFWMNQNATYGETGAKAYAGEFKGKKFGYLGHEIYLLPGQMLPEHRHIGGAEGFGPKMESWHIRHGSVEFYGEYQSKAAKEGDKVETPVSAMPAANRPFGFGQDWFKSKFVIAKGAGGIYTLQDPESWHFMRAGPNGAIVSEYATFHNQVEFSKPDMKFASSEAKK